MESKIEATLSKILEDTLNIFMKEVTTIKKMIVTSDPQHLDIITRNMDQYFQEIQDSHDASQVHLKENDLHELLP